MIIALWNGGANISAIVRTLRDEGEITTRATILRLMYAILLLLRTNIPALIPVSSIFSLLVISFAAWFIQADLLLLHDSVANLV